jgi:hypothetical protein
MMGFHQRTETLEVMRSMPVPLLLLVLVLTGLASVAVAEDSTYSDALKLKKQIEQMTGGKLAPETAAGEQQQPEQSLHLDAPKRDAGCGNSI